MTAMTFSGPNARTASANTTAESTPPLMPTTPPYRRRVFLTVWRSDWTMRSASRTGSMFRRCLLNLMGIVRRMVEGSLHDTDSPAALNPGIDGTALLNHCAGMGTTDLD